jgi:hypothetical protein
MTEVDKRKILQILRDRGPHARAEWVDRQLSERVDPDKNAGLLADPAHQPSRAYRSPALTGCRIYPKTVTCWVAIRPRVMPGNACPYH